MPRPTEGINYADLQREVNAIIGGNTANESAGQESKLSFKKQVNEAKSKLDKTDEVDAEFDGKVKALSRLERVLKRSEGSETKISAISHERIMEAHKTGTSQEKMWVDLNLMAKVFIEKGNAGPIGNNGLETLTLDNLWDLGDKDASRIDWAKIRNDPEFAHKPQIYYKPIRKPGALGKVQTDDVQIIMILNNGDTPEENTVVTAQVKHKGGKLMWGLENPGLYNVRSEKEFRDIVSKPGRPTVEQKLCKGDLTIDEYRRDYPKQDRWGRRLDVAWKDHDARITAQAHQNDTHAGERATEKEARDARRRALIEELNDSYSEKLELLEAAQTKIIQNINKRVEAIQNRREAVIKNVFFAHIKKLSAVTPVTPETTAAIETMIKTIAKDSGSTEAEIKNLAGI
jgi:hypothetical protein